jgi:hypothetical protein
MDESVTMNGLVYFPRREGLSVKADEVNQSFGRGFESIPGHCTRTSFRNNLCQQFYANADGYAPVDVMAVIASNLHRFGIRNHHKQK